MPTIVDTLCDGKGFTRMSPTLKMSKIPIQKFAKSTIIAFQHNPPTPESCPLTPTSCLSNFVTPTHHRSCLSSTYDQIQLQQHQHHTQSYSPLPSSQSTVLTLPAYQSSTSLHDRHIGKSLSSLSDENFDKEMNQAATALGLMSVTFEYEINQDNGKKTLFTCDERYKYIASGTDNNHSGSELVHKTQHTPTRTKKSNRTNKKKVSFSSVHVREYSVVIGDHPSCISGLPLSLGWSHTPSAVHNIDSYQQNKLNGESASTDNTEVTNKSNCVDPFATREIAKLSDEEAKYATDMVTASACTKLSYIQRKSLLKRVNGLTENDIMRIERKRQHKLRDKKNVLKGKNGYLSTIRNQKRF